MARVAADQREALAETRRDQIVAAAIRRWLVDGFDATTVASIAREAELAKGTVYIYFKTKQDILDEAIRRYSLLPDLETFFAAMSNVPSERSIPLLVKGIWSTLRARVDIIRLFVRELTVRPEHARHFLETVIIPANEAMADFYRAAAERGELRDLDMFVAARALVGMLVAFVFTQFVYGGDELRPISDEAVVETVTDLFLHGVLARGEGGDAQA
jgi:AcrR family transcriptional regulator